MSKIVIYTSPFCPFCVRAKKLLERKGIAFEEIDVSVEPGSRERMVERSGGRQTVPQIFVGDRRIGDCNEIHALDAAGKLDDLLVGA